MPWPLVALAVGSGVVAFRYLYRRYPNMLKLKPPNPQNRLAANDPAASLGSRFSRANLSGFGHPMSFSEACSILNISSTSSKEKIRESHKQLMKRNHPDNGGSTYLASKVNEAKDFLLK